MIVDLIRKAARTDQSGASQADAFPTLPPAQDTVRRVDIGRKGGRIWGMLQTAGTKFLDAAGLIPGMGLDLAGRRLAHGEIQGFAEGGAYVANGNGATSGGVRIEPAVSNNWVVKLVGDTAFEFAETLDISDPEADLYSKRDRVRFSPLTVVVLHNGYRLLQGGFSIPQGFAFPEDRDGETWLSFVHVNVPGNNTATGWRLYNLVRY